MPLMALSAPLAHIHPDDHESAHHQGRARHAHFHGHTAPAPAPGEGVPSHDAQLDHDDSERTISAHLFLAVAADTIDAAAAPTPVFVLLVPQVIAVGRTPHVTHGHDPPVAPLRAARPPPAFLS